MNLVKAILISIFSAVGVCQMANSSAMIIDQKFIKSVESRIRLPTGAAELVSYNRYYYVDGSYLRGVFVSSRSHVGKIIIGPKKGAPVVFDGGCGVVNLKILLATGKILEIFCNGVA